MLLREVKKRDLWSSPVACFLKSRRLASGTNPPAMVVDSFRLQCMPRDLPTEVVSKIMGFAKTPPISVAVYSQPDVNNDDEAIPWTLQYHVYLVNGQVEAKAVSRLGGEAVFGQPMPIVSGGSLRAFMAGAVQATFDINVYYIVYFGTSSPVTVGAEERDMVAPLVAKNLFIHSGEILSDWEGTFDTYVRVGAYIWELFH